MFPDWQSKTGAKRLRMEVACCIGLTYLYLHSHAFFPNSGMQLSANPIFAMVALHCTHLLPFPRYYNVMQRVYSTYIHLRQIKSYIASPTRVICSLHSYCWLHYVNYYNYQLLVMELLVNQTHQWCCGIQLFTFSQALGALSTAEDAQVVERLRLKVLYSTTPTRHTYALHTVIMYKS